MHSTFSLSHLLSRFVRKNLSKFQKNPSGKVLMKDALTYKINDKGKRKGTSKQIRDAII